MNLAPDDTINYKKIQQKQSNIRTIIRVQQAFWTHNQLEVNDIFLTSNSQLETIIEDEASFPLSIQLKIRKNFLEKICNFY